MIPVADKAQTGPYVPAFAEHGYAHFRGVYSASQVETLPRRIRACGVCKLGRGC